MMFAPLTSTTRIVPRKGPQNAKELVPGLARPAQTGSRRQDPIMCSIEDVREALVHFGGEFL